jgi:hypothetical protein
MDFGLLYLVMAVDVAARASAVGPTPEDPSVTVITVASDTRDASALIRSAKLAGIEIIVLGQGVAMPWPNGLRKKIELVRSFVQACSLPDDAVLVFVDAWDTMVLADSGLQLLAHFEQVEKEVGRPIIFAPEEYCWPQDAETKDTRCAYMDSVAPVGVGRRRYLNSGMYAGRLGAMKQLVSAPVPELLPLSDQVIQVTYTHKVVHSWRMYARSHATLARIARTQRSHATLARNARTQPVFRSGAAVVPRPISVDQTHGSLLYRPPLGGPPPPPRPSVLHSGA